jgi:epidermal growth factor receptor substrate 15
VDLLLIFYEMFGTLRVFVFKKWPPACSLDHAELHISLLLSKSTLHSVIFFFKMQPIGMLLLLLLIQTLLNCTLQFYVIPLIALYFFSSLVQIWTYADRNRSGFLGREDFFNSLKLVTVAQSGRELTPDIVKSALFGPAAAKIPAPRINVSTAAPQTNSVASLPNATQAPGPVQQSPAPGPVQQNPAIRGIQGLPGASPNPQVRPPQPPNANTVPPAHGQGVASRPPMGSGPTGLNHTSSTIPSLATDWFGGKRGASPLGATSQAPTRGISPQANLSSAGISAQNSTPVPGYNSHTPGATTPVNANSTNLNMMSSQPSVNDSKALVPLGNGLSSNSTFGADPFSATSQPKQGSPLPPNVPNNLTSSTPPASAAGHHHPPKPMQAGPVQGISSLSSHTSQLPHSQPAPRQQQFNATPNAPGPVSSNIPSGQIPSNPSQSQAPWPKITQVDVRKYMIVFIKVDRDRDGKITGEEARNLFLSWRLPRGTSCLFIFTLPFLDTIIHSPCALYFLSC